MKILFRSLASVAALAVAATTLPLPQPASAASAAELTREAQAALNSLYAKNAGAKAIGKNAVAVARPRSAGLNSGPRPALTS